MYGTCWHSAIRMLQFSRDSLVVYAMMLCWFMARRADAHADDTQERRWTHSFKLAKSEGMAGFLESVLTVRLLPCSGE